MFFDSHKCEACHGLGYYLPKDWFTNEEFSRFTLSCVTHASSAEEANAEFERSLGEVFRNNLRKGFRIVPPEHPRMRDAFGLLAERMKDFYKEKFRAVDEAKGIFQVAAADGSDIIVYVQVGVLLELPER